MKILFPTSLNLGIYYEKDKHWTKEQCKVGKIIMPIYPRELKECQKECDDNSKCNAIEYANKESYCTILECIDPVPQPTNDTALSNVKMLELYANYLELFYPNFNYLSYAKGIVPFNNCRIFSI